MTYKLVYTNRAIRDLHAATDWIARRAPKAAENWFLGFIASLERLKVDAHVFGLAPENENVQPEIRQLIYRTKSRRSNRALYTIRDETVVILAIRRPGQELLTVEELRNALDEAE